MGNNFSKAISSLGVVIVIAAMGCKKGGGGNAYLPRLSAAHIQTVILKRQQCTFKIDDPLLIGEIQSAFANKIEAEAYILVTQTNLVGSNFVGGSTFYLEFIFDNGRPINTAGQLFTFGLTMETTYGPVLGDPDYGHFIFTEKQSHLRQLAQAIQPFLFMPPDSYKVTTRSNQVEVTQVTKPI